MLKVISHGPIFSPLLTGKFLVVFSAAPLPTAAQFESFDHVSAETPWLSARDARRLPSYTNSLWTTWAGDLISLSSVWRLPCKLVWLCHSAATALGESRRYSVTWHQWGTIGCSSYATIECFRRRWHLIFISRLLINLALYRNNSDIYSRKPVWVQRENKAHTSIILQESALTL